MKPMFDPTDPKALEAALADLAGEEVALDPSFRATLVADAARVTAPPPARPWAKLAEWLGLAGLPAAALAGAWLGIANPALVMQVSPWDSTLSASDVEDEAFLDEVFGGSWVSLEDTQ